jgi:hypothetical protein
MYYADEITLEVCEKLLAQLSKSKQTRRYY